MPHDLLQITLEHHRAGRVRQAEAGYRALLDANPDHPDALHWLGVLMFQAGRPDNAVELLERAAAERPEDPAFLHNLGQAYLSVGRSDDAVGAFDLSAAYDPDRAATLVGGAHARLARKAPGDAAAAVAALRDAVARAQAAGEDSAELHHDLGVALLADGKADEAIPAFRAALSKQGDHASAYHHLALAHRARGETKEVRRNLNKALEIDPGLAKAWYALAALEAEAGSLPQAAVLFRRAIKAKADYAAAYQALGRVLERDGRADEAAAALEMAERVARGEVSRPTTSAQPDAAAAIERMEQRLNDPKAATFHHSLAALAGVFPSAQVPTSSVADLFERYAERFDDHLRGTLRYGVPELLADAVAAALTSDSKGRSDEPNRRLDVFDLGCGTGLCGPLLRPMAATLVGVDLSPAMIERARGRGAYDRLEVGELTDALRKSPRAWDLLAAADVVIYTGDLSPFFEAAGAALRPGGLLAFSVEAGGGDRYYLQAASRRYAHSEPYLRRLASIHGFDVVAFNPIPIRLEKGKPVPGYLLVLRLLPQ